MHLAKNTSQLIINFAGATVRAALTSSDRVELHESCLPPAIGLCHAVLTEVARMQTHIHTYTHTSRHQQEEIMLEWIAKRVNCVST